MAATGFALDDFPLRSFTTLVHSLKCALANIGADVLLQSAALLEKAGREADLPMIRDNLPQFREELAALMRRIRESTAAARAGGNETRVEPDIGEALACLREALETKDFEAMDAALAQLQTLSLSEKTRRAASEIADAILTADFQKAADAVNILLVRDKSQ
jgi:HPt (histidine-containing phosphotransfer) domain-containing protein